MEKLLKTKNIPYVILAAGGLGAVLQFILFTFGSDGKGLLTRGSFLSVLLWVLVFAACVLLAVGTRDLKQAPKYSFNFPASVTGAAGAAAAAAGLLITSVGKLLTISDFLVLLDALLGILGAAALLFISRCRWKGLHPSVIFHTLVCVYLMVDLVCLYRLRSADPQIQSYCFSLLASVCLMLACYYNAAFAANTGDRQKHTLSHLLAVFFCLTGLPGCENAVFYLTMGFWMFTDLCDLTPLPRSIPE